MKCLLLCVGMVYLCRPEECYSTVTGVQEYSRWWLHPAAHSQHGRRRSASLLLGKRPFQSFARWWRQRQGSCMVRTFQLGIRTESCIINMLLYTFFSTSVNLLWLLGLTDTFGQPLAPLGCSWIPVVAGEEAGAGQDVTFVADKLHSGPYGEAAACDHFAAVLHVSRIPTRHNWQVTKTNAR